MSARCTASRPWTPASANPARTRISNLQCTKRADPSVKRTPASVVAGLVLRALMTASERRFTPSGSSNLSQGRAGRWGEAQATRRIVARVSRVATALWRRRHSIRKHVLTMYRGRRASAARQQREERTDRRDHGRRSTPANHSPTDGGERDRHRNARKRRRDIRRHEPPRLSSMVSTSTAILIGVPTIGRDETDWPQPNLIHPSRNGEDYRRRHSSD